MKVLVTGAGGFIGNWLVRYLKQQEYWVRGADLKRPEWSESAADEFLVDDLRYSWDAKTATWGIDWIFHLAANMGGIGFLETAHAEMISDNTRIDMNVIQAARENGVGRLLFSSSACIYPCYLQEVEEAPLLKESDAYPADPQGAYGWSKLHTEHLCKYYRKAGWVDTRIVRFHNCFGSEGSWQGGREKAPAALCRKIAIAKLSGNPEVEIWGDGTQVRSYMYIDDCVEGLLRLMQSDYPGPVNFGRDRGVTVDELADVIAEIAGIKIIKKHIEGPTGVHARNSDNSLCQEKLGWEPSISLEKGLEITYRWVEGQVLQNWDEMNV